MSEQTLLMDSMRWSELTPTGNDGSEIPGIKNHSVAFFQDILFTFGGYDGRRNHMALTLYCIKEKRWVRPQQIGDQSIIRMPTGSEIMVRGTPPPGRNGHTATLVVDPKDEKNAQIIIIGGWLGTGPLAASDMHVLNVEGGTLLQWHQPNFSGTAPGPCNMHSADYIAKQKEVYVFRGGNGREYLNDLHALNVETFSWRRVETTGQEPQQRANHSSSLLEEGGEGGELFIFGGWNGIQRLNDIHILDIATSTWTCPHVGGELPNPRAGMTLTALRGRLYLFGGSGTSSKCFDDLQILDREEMAWLDVIPFETPSRRSFFDYDDPLVGESYHSQSTSYQDAAEEMTNAARSRSDWRSRVGPGILAPSSNPNDEQTVATVVVHGNGPGRRAGHTATAVNRRIYVFGGSCGSDYLRDFYVLDTDPPPQALVTEPASLQLLEHHVRLFFNDEQFSDVTFLVEGQVVYGHKMILSIVSECFRAMFTTGFRESEEGAEIVIPECTHDAFLSMMEYIYKGQTLRLTRIPETEEDINRVVALLQLADRFFLDHLKQKCETVLQPAVNANTAESLLRVAQETNAVQLGYICEHHLRNRDPV